MKSLCIIIPLVVLLLASCGRKTSRNIGDPVRPPSEVNMPEQEKDATITPTAPDTPKLPEKRIFVIASVVKSPCYGGGCPHYEFRLSNDGIAYYTCRSGCKPRIGQYYAFIGRKKVTEILEYIKEEDLAALDGVYPTDGQPVENIPLTTFTIATSHLRRKNIRSYHHTPKKLIILGEMIEELIEETDWELTYE